MGTKQSQQPTFEHPYDTPLSSGLRFLVEVIVWVAGPWTAATQSFWLFIPAVVVLIGLPAIFSTRGDKRQIVVATPGPLRALLELGLQIVAVGAAWVVWPAWLAVGSTVAVAAAVATGIPRTIWLLRGAPTRT